MFYDEYVRLCNSINKTPTAVAKEIGLAGAHVTKWKNGSTPTDATKFKICEFFHLPYDYFNKNKTAPTPKDERSNDPDIRRIERARKNMSDQDRQKMMNILKASFEDYFSDDYIDTDTDE